MTRKTSYSSFIPRVAFRWIERLCDIRRIIMDKKKLRDPRRHGTAEQEPIMPQREPGNTPEAEPRNTPEAEPGNRMVSPDAEQPPQRSEGIVSDPDR